MKTFVLVACLLGVASAIDLSKVREIGDDLLDHPALKQQILHSDGPKQRIVNGDEANPGQFPFYVYLNFDRFEANAFVCGGSILTSNFILTAGRCPFDGGNLLLSGTALVGAQIQNIQEPSQQRITFTSSGIFVHPEYTSSNNQRNNIALLRLDSPIIFNDRAQPVRLPARSDIRQFGGIIGTAVGFGQTVEGDDSSRSNVLLYITNPIMTNTQCRTSFGNVLIEPQNVCISGAFDRGGCGANHGGPLVVHGDLLIGVLSTRIGCNPGAEQPVLYTRVSYFLDWIEANSDYIVNP